MQHVSVRRRMAEHAKPTTLGFFFRSLPGTISSPDLETSLGHAGLTGDLRADATAMQLLRDHLLTRGFTAAPHSAELVGMLNEVHRDDLHQAGADFGRCVGLSAGQLEDFERFGFLSPPIARVVRASVTQLEAVLPADSVVLGAVEGTFRKGVVGGIGWLHHDEHRTSLVHLEQALFPSSLRCRLGKEASVITDDVFHNYNRFAARMMQEHPKLVLPDASECVVAESQDDGTGLDDAIRTFSHRVIAALQAFNRAKAALDEDELVLDIVNVWIPKADKQIAVLPFEFSKAAVYEHDTRPSVEEAEAAGFKDEFQTFCRGTAVLFFGRYVLHQAAEGPEFIKCWHGSMETRYLVLTPRKSAHRFSCCRPSCLTQAEGADPY